MRNITKNIQNKTPRHTIDTIMYVVAFVYPLTTIPQIATIFANHSAANISLVSWAFYFACSVVTLIYAFYHRLIPLIIEGFLWLVMNGSVVIGILIYN